VNSSDMLCSIVGKDKLMPAHVYKETRGTDKLDGISGSTRAPCTQCSEELEMRNGCKLPQDLTSSQLSELIFTVLIK